MKELQYPFDSAYLLKKRKAIKKELLSMDSSRIEKRIAVLGGSTTNDIVAMTELFLLDYGISPVFYQSEYNRYWQDAVFGNEELDAFKPDIVFVHTSSRNIIQYPEMTDTREQTNRLFEQQMSHFEAMWQALAKKFKCPVIQNNFEILKDLLETNQYHAALLSRIENKIDNNLWCPILKKELVK